MIKNEQWFKEQHEKMWQWLADNPTKGKSEWGGWIPLQDQWDILHMNYCFACAFAKHTMDKLDHMCEYCPCWKYEDHYYMCEDKTSPYTIWDEIGSYYWDVTDEEEWSEEDMKERSRLALEIKNMWRDV